jgi:probable rRNA maturation factor
LEFELQMALSENFSGDFQIPSESKIEYWVSSTLVSINVSCQNLTIRLVDEDEVQSLNKQYRDKDKTTNVLSFPFEPLPDVEFEYLGDIVICVNVVKQESVQQHKSFESHFAHMVIHGTLHLCGFDHQTDAEAEEMEAVEYGMLRTLSLE